MTATSSAMASKDNSVVSAARVLQGLGMSQQRRRGGLRVAGTSRSSRATTVAPVLGLTVMSLMRHALRPALKARSHEGRVGFDPAA